MPQWLIYGSSNTQEQRVFVRPSDITAVKETNDGHSILILDNGVEIGVSAPALSVMAAISSPPPAPVMVARLSSPTDQTPLLSGAAEPFATVVVRDGGTQVVVTKADATERWEANSTPLAPGSHTLIATQTDIFGLVSPPSAPCSLDIAAPPAPEPAAPAVEATPPAAADPAATAPETAAQTDTPTAGDLRASQGVQ